MRSRSRLIILAVVALTAGCSTLDERQPVEGDATRLKLREQNQRTAKALAAYSAGLMAYQDRQFADAIEKFELVLELDPARIKLYQTVAEHYLIREKDSAHAIAVARDGCRANPDSVAAHLILAHIYRDTLNIERAIKQYERLLDMSTADETPYVELSALHRRRGDEGQALDVLRRGAERLDDPYPVLHQLGEHYLKKSGKATGEEADAYLVKAISWYEKAAAVSTNQTQLSRYLASHFLRADDLAKAAAYLEKLTAADPRDVRAWRQLAFCYQGLNDLPAAVRVIKELVRQNPDDPQFYHYLGLLHETMEDYDEAIRYYGDAVQRRPVVLEAFFRLAVLQLAEHPDKSIEVLAEAKALAPENDSVYTYLGLAYSSTGDYERAASEFSAVADLVKRHKLPDRRLHPQYYYWYGAAMERLGRHAEAEELLEKHIALYPEYIDTYNYLAYMWSELGINLDKALVYINKALTAEPDNPAYLDTLGWIYYRQHEYDKALVEVQRALRLMPDDAVVAEHLGDIFHAMKDTDQALPLWRQSYRADPANDKLAEKLREQGVGEEDLRELSRGAMPDRTTDDAVVPPASPAGPEE